MSDIRSVLYWYKKYKTSNELKFYLFIRYEKFNRSLVQTRDLKGGKAATEGFSEKSRLHQKCNLENNK